jgi:hypothetical protein
MLVDMWKAAWMQGANARWSPNPNGSNPFAPGMERAAWDAGWEWAGRNPNRRSARSSRVAHRRRRATDSALPTTVKRAVGLGAAGVTVYAISKALLRWTRSGRPES